MDQGNGNEIKSKSKKRQRKRDWKRRREEPARITAEVDDLTLRAQSHRDPWKIPLGVPALPYLSEAIKVKDKEKVPRSSGQKYQTT